MQAIRSMVDRIVQPRDEGSFDYEIRYEDIYKNSILEAIFWQPLLFLKNFCELLASFLALTFYNSLY